MSPKEFDRIVRRSIRRIPREIRRHLDNVLISVQKRPSRKLLAEMGLPPDQSLLGCYQGISLIERSSLDQPLYPDRILLFQEPMEEMCDTFDEVEKQVEITVVHEIAHFLGFSEERLSELGYE